MGAHPDGGVGVGGEGVSVGCAGGVGGDRAGDVDAAGGGEGVGVWDGGGDGGGERAGGEECGEEDLGKHCGWCVGFGGSGR